MTTLLLSGSSVKEPRTHDTALDNKVLVLCTQSERVLRKTKEKLIYLENTLDGFWVFDKYKIFYKTIFLSL